jgi:N6-adenosine-specific RNA methylase IME4
MAEGSARVIYADPPWRFITRNAKGKGRSSEAWYDCMSLPELQALPVAQMGARDSILLLWTTRTYLELAMALIPTWGYRYKSIAVHWLKTTKDGQLRMGMGYGTRCCTEQLLLASRRKGVPRLRRDVLELIYARRGPHSRKPVEAYELVEKMWRGPYLELFARQQRAGWLPAFGLEVDSGPLQQRRWRSDSYPQAAE